MGSNKKASVRNARTAVTSAQNGGRQKGFEQAHELGIKFKKEWLSAHDGRVRDSHAHLDGVQVEYDEKFPNGLRYPADPQGHPSEVYNCRCTLIADLLGKKRTKNTIESYEAWLDVKKANLLASQSDSLSDSLNIMSFRKPVSDESIKKLKDVVGFKSVKSSIRQLDGYVVENATNQLATLEERFDIIHSLDNSSITGLNDSDKPTALGYVDFISGKLNTTKLHLCPNCFKSKANGIGIVKESVSKGDFMPCNESNYVIYTATHEYGHILKNTIIGKQIEADDYEGFMAMRSQFKNELSSIAKELDKSVDINSVISQCGKISDGEFFAECFANSQLGNSNILGNAMEIWLKRKGL